MRLISRVVPSPAAKRVVRGTLRFGLEFAGSVVNMLLFPLARHVPRNPVRWVFGHQDGQFAGNPKYLFLWILRNSRIRAVWITGNWHTYRSLKLAGFPVAMRWSPRGMYYTATAGAAFFAHRTSDINAALTNGAFLANLWHGVGLKTIHLGHPKGLTSAAQRHRSTRFGRARYRTYLVVPDIVATTSDFMQAHFAAQFQLPADRCPKLGYPRVDCALDDALWTMATKLDSRPDFALTPDGFSEAYVYLPTSRDSNRPLLAPALPDLSRLSGALAKRRALFYIKLHPRTRESVPSAYDNIRAWPTSIEYPIASASLRSAHNRLFLSPVRLHRDAVDRRHSLHLRSLGVSLD